VQVKEVFPLYLDKFPIQLLNYLRFTRIQDIGELAKARFDQDVIISQQNEYEVLQLVMGDLRERLQGYRDNQVWDLRNMSVNMCLLEAVGQKQWSTVARSMPVPFHSSVWIGVGGGRKIAPRSILITTKKASSLVTPDGKGYFTIHNWCHQE
jgi:hypothetical protein